MATKGASNHYGNSRGGRQGYATDSVGFAWAKGFNKATLYQHFYDHGEQMNCSTKEAYAAHAVTFANTVNKKDYICKVKNGTTYKFDKKTGTFAMITKSGVVITYFKPKAGYKYFLQQFGGKK